MINFKNAMFLIRLNTHGRARQMARRRKTNRLLVGLLGSFKLRHNVDQTFLVFFAKNFAIYVNSPDKLKH